jgi:hypothetical protein
MKVTIEIYQDGERQIRIMRASDPEVAEVSIYKESSGKVGMYLSGNDDFYCNNSIEEMQALQERIEVGIKIAKDFEFYWEKYSNENQRR